MTPCMVPTQDCGLDLWIWWMSLLSLTIWQRRSDLNKALISWFWVKEKGYYFGWTWPNWVTPLKYSPGIPWSQKFQKTETLSLVGFEEASFHEFCNLQEMHSVNQPRELKSGSFLSQASRWEHSRPTPWFQPGKKPWEENPATLCQIAAYRNHNIIKWEWFQAPMLVVTCYTAVEI